MSDGRDGMDLARKLAALSPEKRERLESLLLAGRGGEVGMFPLSFAQQRLWFLDRLRPGEAVYNMPAAVRLRGALDAAALERGLAEMIARHEILRTAFAEVHGRPVQAVAEDAALALPRFDLSGGPEPEAEARRRAGEAARQPFDLARAPLLRAELLRLGDDDHLLVLVFHHIVADEASVAVFVRELAALYTAFTTAFTAGRPSPLPEPPLQYADFAVWQREQALDGALNYWRGRLAGELPALAPARDRRSDAARTGRGGRRPAGFGADAAERVRGLARAEGATPFAVWLAAFAALLHRYTGEEDVVIGAPAANRNRPELREVVGFFVNTLALRLDLAGDPPFRELVRRARAAVLEAFAHQDAPFERIVEELRPERRADATPLFQVMLAYQEGTPRRLDLPGLAVTLEPVESGAAKLDLTLELADGADGLAGALEYDAGLYDAATVDRLAVHLRRLLDAALGDPGLRLSELPLEEARPLASPDVAGGNDLLASLERRAASRPDDVALSQGDLAVTYGELNRRANRLARHLRRLGIGPEARVGLALEPSPGLAVALWAVLKSGGAWVPLDPAQPRERLAALLEEAGAGVVLTAETLSGDLAGEPDGDLGIEIPAAAAAYVLFTSGSTGRPKGVVVSRGALAWHARATAAVFGLGPADRVPQLAPVAFDVALEEMFPTWASGGRVVFPPSRLSPVELSAFAEREGLTVFNMGASLWREWVAEMERAGAALPASLRLVATGSEPVDAATVAAWHRLGSVRLLNAYGLTEATVTSLVRELDEELPDGPVPIGRPLPGVRAAVLGRLGEPVPEGGEGELALGGPGLARGYLGRPDLTAERFVPDGNGERLLRTGDLARVKNGEIQVLGRVDRQLKVRGFRVEPAEVEAALARHPAVREAAVGLWRAAPGDDRLTAWVAGEGDLDLRAFLGESLPSYLIPSSFVVLERLPRTPSGKLDRRALPAPTAETRPADQPRTPLQELIAAVWEPVLGVSGFGVEESFFDLGGHSLLAAQAAARLSEALGVEVPLRLLFEAPTVAGLAREVAALRRGGGLEAPPLVPVPRTAPPPLSFAQERLWFLDRLQPGGAVYNMPAALWLRGPLREDLLERSLREVARRHEILRTRYVEIEGAPAQAVDPDPAIELRRIDLTGLPAGLRRPAAHAVAAQEARRGFDLQRGPVLRAAVVRLGGEPEERLLLLTLHHIAADGWSFAVLVRETGELYRGASPPPLPLPLQYADYAVWQRAWLSGAARERQLAFWRERLRGAATLELPADRPRPPVQSFRGASRPLAVPAETAAALRALARRRGATLFMVLLAGVDTLLARLSGQEDIVLGAPAANRERPGSEGMIGLFLNMLVLRAGLAGDPGFGELLRRVRETALDAYAHQDIPFETLVDELRPERDLSRNPLFQVMLAFQGAPVPPLGLPGVAEEPLAVASGAARFDLTFSLEETADGAVAGSIEYAADLWDAATVDRLGARLAVLLAGAGAEPGRRLSELPVLTGLESRQVIADWNDTRLEVPAAGIHELFERRAAAAPGAVAVIHEGEALTYGELAGRVRGLARRLRALGIGPESRVGVCVERSPDLVVALLGVLAAGGAYVPLDPGYPRERLAWILEDSGVAALVTRPGVRGSLPRELPAGLAVLDEAWEESGDDGPATAIAASVPEQPAYVIYTSGSTGRPKGVVVTHANAVNFFAGMDRVLGFEETSAPGVWLAVTSVSFDISVLELLWTLTRGFRVVLQGRETEGYWLAAPEAGAARPVDLSLFYFADAGGDPGDRYRLLLEGARFADRHGFTAVWTPERHFHAFGGLYPNPAVTGAAVAAVTERIEVRAGSVVLPLHDPVRVAEEWAVVDNLSRGRVSVSFASGWHVDDFVLAPGNFRRRKEVMLEGIETVRRLWRGETVSLPNGEGRATPVAVHPRPIQPELPVWLTAAGHPDTFRAAAEAGAGVLTHLLSQTEEELRGKIAVYREAWKNAGHPGEGRVALMLHTFLGDDREAVRATAREPFRRYLRSSVDLLRGMAREMGLDSEDLREADLEILLDRAVERYFESAGLFGTPADAVRTAERLRAAGVDEIACLIDFGVETDLALAGLRSLAEAGERLRKRSAAGDTSIPAQIRRHGVTHLQCTPSMARLLAADSATAAALGGLRKLLLGGEALPPSLVEELRRAAAGLEIINVYGPTETTVWSTSHPVDGAAAPIGRPIANTAAYVVDARLRPVPPGVPGELLLGGAGVTRGYLERPELTAERFVPDAFSNQPGGRLYRTGDLARWRPDGILEYLGRIDQQVKIRGHRIEPGEIEAALERHPGVREAVVVAREDQPGFPRLAAYVVPAASAAGPVALPLRAGPEVREALLDGRQRFTLPNGMLVAHLGDLHTRVGYAEIFVNEPYLVHGVTLEDGDVIFDVGANIGFFTLYVHGRCRPSAVYAFEPIPPTFDALSANVGLYGLDAVRLFHCGVGAAPEQAEFTFYPHLDGLSGRYADVERDRAITRAVILEELKKQGGNGHGLGLRIEIAESDIDELLAERFRVETFACPVRTLSDVIREQGVERIDLLKIDVERAEVDVLDGLRDEDWPRVRQIVLEVDTRENLEILSRRLAEKGFDFVAEDFVRVDEGETPVEVSMLYAVRRGMARPARPKAERVTAAGLRAALRDELPEPMVPESVVLLDALPLTPSGKVDRKSLPRPEDAFQPARASAADYVAPESAAEQRIAAVWRELLGVPRIGLHENFFEAGGNSLLLARVHGRLREELGRDFSMLELFRHPTVGSLAAFLSREEAPAEPAGRARDRAERQAEARESGVLDRQRRFLERRRQRGTTNG